ncbi:MAG: histidinol dehydrogenase [Polyangiaceae bacterium]
MTLLKIVEEPSAAFTSELTRLGDRGVGDLAHVEPSVRQILEDVRREGDAAVHRYSERFDGRRAPQIFTRELDGAGALARLPKPLSDALKQAADRIRAFHERQRERGFYYEGAESSPDAGIRLGARARAVRRAGVYAPGGKARYPSSVLMAAIPAQVAGVVDIVLATPGPDDLLLAAAHLSGVTAVVDAGGAQAIGALAFGTQTVPRVDKIVGPGNIFVACAKRLVLGYVDIDGIAGPSEILVVADRSAQASVVAADLLSQAEHDEDAYPLLVTTERGLAEAVERELVKQLSTLPRKGVAQKSLQERGAALVVSTRSRLLEVADFLAVEHVALHVERPDEAFDAIGAMGAAFVGDSTPEAAGDYIAGPSHVLPTGGAVRFGSPLGVYDFLARTSYIRYSREALTRQADAIVTMARAEGLEAHARAVLVRTGGLS